MTGVDVQKCDNQNFAEQTRMFLTVIVAFGFFEQEAKEAQEEEEEEEEEEG